MRKDEFKIKEHRIEELGDNKKTHKKLAEDVGFYKKTLEHLRNTVDPDHVNIKSSEKNLIEAKIKLKKIEEEFDLSTEDKIIDPEGLSAYRNTKKILNTKVLKSISDIDDGKYGYDHKKELLETSVEGEIKSLKEEIYSHGRNFDYFRRKDGKEWRNVNREMEKLQNKESRLKELENWEKPEDDSYFRREKRERVRKEIKDSAEKVNFRINKEANDISEKDFESLKKISAGFENWLRKKDLRHNFKTSDLVKSLVGDLANCSREERFAKDTDKPKEEGVSVPSGDGSIQVKEFSSKDEVDLEKEISNTENSVQVDFEDKKEIEVLLEEYNQLEEKRKQNRLEIQKGNDILSMFDKIEKDEDAALDICRDDAHNDTETFRKEIEFLNKDDILDLIDQRISISSKRIKDLEKREIISCGPTWTDLYYEKLFSADLAYLRELIVEKEDDSAKKTETPTDESEETSEDSEEDVAKPNSILQAAKNAIDRVNLKEEGDNIENPKKETHTNNKDYLLKGNEELNKNEQIYSEILAGSYGNSDKLTSITKEVLEELIKDLNGNINLGGLTSISLGLAGILSKANKITNLEGVKKIDIDLAKTLSTISFIYLDAADVSVEVAKELLNVKILNLKLENISESIAEELMKHNHLSLTIQNISPEVAKILSENQAELGSLELSKENIESNIIDILSKRKGSLIFSNKEITLSEVRSLKDHKGLLQLGVEKITLEQLEVLAEHDGPITLYSLSVVDINVFDFLKSHEMFTARGDLRVFENKIEQLVEKEIVASEELVIDKDIVEEKAQEKPIIIPEDSKTEEKVVKENKLEFKEEFYVYPPSEDGHFDDEKTTHFEATETPYKLSLYEEKDESGNDGEFEFVNDENSYQSFTVQYNEIIEPVCKELNKENSSTERIITVEKGKIRKDGDKWVVTKKAKIRYVPGEKDFSELTLERDGKTK